MQKIKQEKNVKSLIVKLIYGTTYIFLKNLLILVIAWKSKIIPKGKD